MKTKEICSDLSPDSRATQLRCVAPMSLPSRLDDWIVYSKRPFGGPEHALRYLGAYTHRVGISNSRVLALSEGRVSFRWRDSAHGNRKRVMSSRLQNESPRTNGGR